MNKEAEKYWANEVIYQIETSMDEKYETMTDAQKEELAERIADKILYGCDWLWEYINDAIRDMLMTEED